MPGIYSCTKKTSICLREALIVVGGDHKPSKKYGVLDDEKKHSREWGRQLGSRVCRGVGDGTSAYKKNDVKRIRVHTAICKMDNWDFPGGPVVKTVPPMQGARVQLLVRELDPRCQLKIRQLKTGADRQVK